MEKQPQKWRSTIVVVSTLRIAMQYQTTILFSIKFHLLHISSVASIEKKNEKRQKSNLSSLPENQIQNKSRRKKIANFEVWRASDIFYPFFGFLQF